MLQLSRRRDPAEIGRPTLEIRVMYQTRASSLYKVLLLTVSFKFSTQHFLPFALSSVSILRPWKLLSNKRGGVSSTMKNLTPLGGRQGTCRL